MELLAVSQGARPSRRWRGVHKALADPLRIQLLEALWDRPRSAGELAECVDLPADRLYYHLAQLEAAGLVEVSEYRRLARGKVERIYSPATVEPPGDAATPEEITAFLNSVLDATKADIAAAHRAQDGGRRRDVFVHRGTVRLTDTALTRLHARIDELLGELSTSGDGVWTRIVITLADLQDRDPTEDTP